MDVKHHVYLLEGNKGPSVAMDLLLFKWTQNVSLDFVHCICACSVLLHWLTKKSETSKFESGEEHDRERCHFVDSALIGLSVGDVMNKTAMCG